MNKLLNKVIRIGLFAFWLVGVASYAWSETIVIVSSDSLTSTRRTISGARSAIKSQHTDVTFVPVFLRPESEPVESQVASIEAARPDVILTVGSAATRLVKENFAKVPIVFASVMYPALSGFVESAKRPGQMITGASLDIPVDIQFRYFRQIIPNLKKIGVLYTANTAKLIPPARVIAAEMGLKLVAVEVTSPRDLPVALDSLSQVTDGLWSLADENLFDPQSTKYILLNSLRQGIPFMGFSRHVVESGALFALDFDYKAIGRQAGRTISAVISGARPGRISVTTPDIIWFHYNEKTAKHMQVEVPAELVAIAKEVYR